MKSKINFKKLAISLGITLIGLFYFGKKIIPMGLTKFSAILFLVGVSLAALGITEYFFGNSHRTFTFIEVFIHLAFAVGILIILTYILPQSTFGTNVFISNTKQAVMSLIGGI